MLYSTVKMSGANVQNHDMSTQEPFYGLMAFFTASSFKSNTRETWHAILVSFADIYLTESLCILAERLS